MHIQEAYTSEDLVPGFLGMRPAIDVLPEGKLTRTIHATRRAPEHVLAWPALGFLGGALPTEFLLDTRLSLSGLMQALLIHPRELESEGYDMFPRRLKSVE